MRILWPTNRIRAIAVLQAHEVGDRGGDQGIGSAVLVVEINWWDRSPVDLQCSIILAYK